MSGMDEQLPKRKNGGARPGAGRKPGGKNALPLGAVGAIKANSLRVPDDASPEHRAAADRAFQRLVDVMEERVFDNPTAVLQAARAVREEVCGPIPKRHELGSPTGGPIVFRIEE